MYNGESTNGYLLSGDQSDTPIPAVAVTPKPWSIVMNFMEQSTSCVSVINGEFGSVSAEYMLTADVACLEGDFKRLRAEITMVDKMGIVGVGHGPSSYALQRITPNQATEIENYHDSVA